MDKISNGIKRVLPLIQLLRKYHRHEVRGVENIPKKGKAIVLSNHSLATYDPFLLGAVIIEKRGRIVRPLGDDLLFRIPVLKDFMSSLGAEPANAQNAEKILREGKLLGIAPGGMREAIRSSKEKYQVLWENRLGFARLAMKTQTPVILTACPHADDIFSIFGGVVSQSVYQKFKFPLVFFSGWGITMIPRPVKLIHEVSKPIFPPNISAESPHFEKELKKWHRSLMQKMNRMMKSTGHY